MDIVNFRQYCLGKPGTSEGMPFGEGALVFRVMSKIFAITSLDQDTFRVNLKCDPDKAISLREQHPDIIPGFHMNKKHWNTVKMEGELSNKLICELIDHSYELVAAGLKKSEKQELKTLSN